MAGSVAPRGEMAARLRAAARDAIRLSGYAGVSFRGLAAEVGVKSATVHYHFPTKDDLATAVIADYTNAFEKTCAVIIAEHRTAAERLAAYADVFQSSLEADGRMCLCGMLSADADQLPEPALAALRDFFDAQEAWVGGVLRDGVSEGELRTDFAIAEGARTLLALLEGSLLVERLRADPRPLSALVAGQVAGWRA